MLPDLYPEVSLTLYPGKPAAATAGVFLVIRAETISWTHSTSFYSLLHHSSVSPSFLPPSSLTEKRFHWGFILTEVQVTGCDVEI